MPEGVASRILSSGRSVRERADGPNSATFVAVNERSREPFVFSRKSAGPTLGGTFSATIILPSDCRPKAKPGQDDGGGTTKFVSSEPLPCKRTMGRCGQPATYRSASPRIISPPGSRTRASTLPGEPKDTNSGG